MVIIVLFLPSVTADLVVDFHDDPESCPALPVRGSGYYDIQSQHPPQFGQADPRLEQRPRIVQSSAYLGEHLHEVPVFIIPCIETEMAEVPHFAKIQGYSSFFNASLYGSILPATWSLMLALRSRGLGSSLTTLHLIYEKEAAEVLGIPSHVTQTALLPVAYFNGSDFRPAKRRPGREVTHWDGWEQNS